MDGPTHYREAERLMAEAFDGDLMFTPDVRARLLRGAQTHALLALVAAQALPLIDAYLEISDDLEPWAIVTGHLEPPPPVRDVHLPEPDGES